MKISEKFEKIRARLDDTQPTESTKKQSDHFEILVDLPTDGTPPHDQYYKMCILITFADFVMKNMIWHSLNP